MQLLTKAADRLLSAVVPHVTAGACLTCPPSWTTEVGCPCVTQHSGSREQYVKTCSRSGCECQTIECSSCHKPTSFVSC
jgi:hypothetical protein